MKKLLALGSVLLLALVALLLWQLHEPADTVTAPAKPVAQPAPAAVDPSVPPGLEKVAAKLAERYPKSDKWETDSDEFQIQFRDVIPQVATRNAMKCYTGGLRTVHRNAKIKFTTKDVIKNGEVTIVDVKLVESTVNDPEMVACMQKEIAATHWHDDKLPDVTEEDMVLVRPERLVNKFSKEAMAYEGSGPDFTKEHPIKAVQ